MIRFPTPSALLSLALTAALCWGATAEARGGGHHGAPDCADRSDDEKAVASLKKQIAAEELVATLELSDDQKSQLAGLVSEALSMRDQKKAARAKRATEARPLLQDYLDDVQSKGSPSDASVEALRALRDESHSERGDYKDMRRGMRERFQAILGEEQLESLRSFRPMAALRPSAPEGEDDAVSEGHGRSRGKARTRGKDDSHDGDRTATARDGRREWRGKRRLVHLLVSEEMLEVLNR